MTLQSMLFRPMQQLQPPFAWSRSEARAALISGIDMDGGNREAMQGSMGPHRWLPSARHPSPSSTAAGGALTSVGSEVVACSVVEGDVGGSFTCCEISDAPVCSALWFVWATARLNRPRFVRFGRRRRAPMLVADGDASARSQRPDVRAHVEAPGEWPSVCETGSGRTPLNAAVGSWDAINKEAGRSGAAKPSKV